MAQTRRPVAQRHTTASPVAASNAAETVDEGARHRTPDAEARELLVEAEVISRAEADEIASRRPARVRQITGGEVHWFTGGGLARETR